MRKALLNLLASLGVWTMLLILIHCFPDMTEIVCAWFAMLIVHNLQKENV